MPILLHPMACTALCQQSAARGDSLHRGSRSRCEVARRESSVVSIHVSVLNQVDRSWSSQDLTSSTAGFVSADIASKPIVSNVSIATEYATERQVYMLRRREIVPEPCILASFGKYLKAFTENPPCQSATDARLPGLSTGRLSEPPSSRSEIAP